MKTIVVLLVICATALAERQLKTSGGILEDSIPDRVKIVDEDVVLDDEGNFSIRFVSEDGITVKEQGIVEEDPTTGAFRFLVQKGYYSYMGEDGQPVELVYDANNPGQIMV